MGGSLPDPNLVAGERHGWHQLYTGLLGAIRNKIAHRSDSQNQNEEEAFADLMLLGRLGEQLAETAARLGQSMP